MTYCHRCQCPKFVQDKKIKAIATTVATAIVTLGADCDWFCARYVRVDVKSSVF